MTLVDHLLYRVWWHGNDCSDAAFLEVIEELLNRVAWIPPHAPSALVHLLLSRVGDAVIGAKTIDDGAGRVSGFVGS